MKALPLSVAAVFACIACIAATPCRHQPAVPSKDGAVTLTSKGAVKSVETFDCEGWPYQSGAREWSKGGSLSFSVDREDCAEGEGCFRFKYSFCGESSDPSKTETLYFQRIFANFRCDFSFRPVELSLMVKGSPSNKGELKIILLQGDMKDKALRHKVLHTFQYTLPKALTERNWKRYRIPFSRFSPLEGDPTPLDLEQVIGWRFELTNPDGTPSEGEFCLDCLQQQTSFKPVWNKSARFSSLCIQLNNTYLGTDWHSVFQSGLDVGIDTWLVQFCVGRKAGSNTSFYKNSTLPWVTRRLDFVDRMFEAAEQMGVKLIIGPYYESWKTKLLDSPAHYDDVFSRNKLVIDDLADNFAKSPAFAGWYIANEFHDGSHLRLNWYDPDCTQCLGDYLEKMASYMKSRKDVPVAVAPALFRGYCARMTADMYDRLFSRTPSVDVLYLQDCCGRGPETITSIGVDLPNYFSEIKKACDRNGVIFGVDIESFFRCDILKWPRSPKSWERLRDQLWMAGNFTRYITNFSWYSFQPGQETYEGYKEYVNSL